MIRWGVVLVLSLVGVAVWGLPPEGFFVDRDLAFRRTPERQAYVKLYQEMTREGWKYQRAAWRDSLTQHLMQARAMGEPYAIGVPGEAPDSVRNRLHAGVRLHLARLGAESPAVPVGAFLVDRAHSAHPAGPERPPRSWWAREYFVGRDGEDPFCFVVQGVNGPTAKELGRSARVLAHIPPDSVSNPNTLRLCGFYARFGDPSASIRDWLASGASHYGMGVGRDRLPPGPGAVRGPLGVANNRGYHSWFVSPRGMACLGGLASACRAVLLRPVWISPSFAVDELEWALYRTGSPVDFLEFNRYRKDFGDWAQFLLDDLVEEFGPARFRRFWTHPGSVDEAFESSFGRSAGSWMMEWAQDRFGTIDRGPGVPVNATFFSLLALGILAGGAVYVGRR